MSMQHSAVIRFLISLSKCTDVSQFWYRESVESFRRARYSLICMAGAEESLLRVYTGEPSKEETPEEATSSQQRSSKQLVSLLSMKCFPIPTL